MGQDNSKTPTLYHPANPNVGMPDRLTEKQYDLYPRYPLRAPDEIKCVPAEVTNIRIPIDRNYNQIPLEGNDSEIFFGSHPWKPKGRKE